SEAFCPIAVARAPQFVGKSPARRDEVAERNLVERLQVIAIVRHRRRLEDARRAVRPAIGPPRFSRVAGGPVESPSSARARRCFYNFNDLPDPSPPPQKIGVCPGETECSDGLQPKEYSELPAFACVGRAYCSSRRHRAPRDDPKGRTLWAQQRSRASSTARSTNRGARTVSSTARATERRADRATAPDRVATVSKAARAEARDRSSPAADEEGAVPRARHMCAGPRIPSGGQVRRFARV